MKTCSKCHELKPEADFHQNAKAIDGLHHNCKACRRAATRPAPGGGRNSTRLTIPKPTRRRTSSNRTRRPEKYTYHDAGKPCPVFSWAEREGWKPTPVELRPFTAWMKPGVGYVWSDAATAKGVVWWFSAREVGGTSRRHTSLADAVAALERGVAARAAA